LEEKKILQRHLGAEQEPEKIDWEAIQKCLPRKRTVARIKQFWQNSIHPLLNRGSWTKQESEQLKELVAEHGKDWETISKRIETRSEDQCRNKWAYEATTLKKGKQTAVFFGIKVMSNIIIVFDRGVY
jgi:bisphosphoglycerate-dependent phosphoglycerate mutase